MRDTLDASVDTLDEITRNKLAIARREALARSSTKHTHLSWRLAASGAVAALLVVILIFQRPDTDTPPTALLQNLELFMLQEELELLEAVNHGSLNGFEDETNPLLEVNGGS